MQWSSCDVNVSYSICNGGFDLSRANVGACLWYVRLQLLERKLNLSIHAMITHSCVSVFSRMYACVYACMFVCLYVCMYVCMYMCVLVEPTYAPSTTTQVCRRVSLFGAALLWLRESGVLGHGRYGQRTRHICTARFRCVKRVSK